jgi:hypothetical protein
LLQKHTEAQHTKTFNPARLTLIKGPDASQALCQASALIGYFVNASNLDAFAKTPGCHPDQQGGIFPLTVKARFLPLVGMTKRGGS